MAVNAAEILACLVDREKDREDEDDEKESDDEASAANDPSMDRDWSKFNPKLGADKKYMNTGTTPQNNALLSLLSFT
jgi:hypothetical protein